MEYHVALQGSDQAPGTVEQPFRSISALRRWRSPGIQLLFMRVHTGNG